MSRPILKSAFDLKQWVPDEDAARPSVQWADQTDPGSALPILDQEARALLVL